VNRRPIVVALLLLAVAAAPVWAQSEGKFAIGGEFALKRPNSPETHGSHDFGPLWRFGHGDDGWGYHWGLNWYATDVDRSVAGTTVELGELRIRPFMAGYGYTYNIRKASVTAALLGGFALTSMTLNPAANDAYRDRLGARSVDASAGAALVARPEVSVWYDVSRKIGVHVNAGYIVARPQVTVSSSLGDDRRRVRADIFSVKVGLAYAVF
jgi:hypothetical protein